MVKKINKDALMIKELIRKGLRQCEISRLLGIKKEKVSYWSRHEIKENQYKRKKLKDIYIETIRRWANDKATSQRSSRKIANMINSLLLKKTKSIKKVSKLPSTIPQ